MKNYPEFNFFFEAFAILMVAVIMSIIAIGINTAARKIFPEEKSKYANYIEVLK